MLSQFSCVILLNHKASEWMNMLPQTMLHTIYYKSDTLWNGKYIQRLLILWLWHNSCWPNKLRKLKGSNLNKCLVLFSLLFHWLLNLSYFCILVQAIILREIGLPLKDKDHYAKSECRLLIEGHITCTID